MPKRVSRRYAVCIDNSGYLPSLELDKLYQVLPDARAEREGALRVVDESGEDDLFEADRFLLVDLPQDSRRVLSRSFSRSHTHAR